MNSFNTLIGTRRSTRKFLDQLLDPEQTASILRAALTAPTSKNAHSWEFIAVEDKATLKALAGCKPHGGAFVESCAMAVVVTGHTEQTDVWIEDASIAAAFMQLQAEALGVGSCWCQVRARMAPDGTTSEQYVRNLLAIPPQYGVLCILAFGYRDGDRPTAERQLPWEKVHVGSFKSPTE